MDNAVKQAKILAWLSQPQERSTEEIKSPAQRLMPRRIKCVLPVAKKLLTSKAGSKQKQGKIRDEYCLDRQTTVRVKF